MADPTTEEPRREGDPTGSPSVLFDPKERRNYHLDRNGNPVFHGVPEGFQFDGSGALVEIPPAPEMPAKPGRQPTAPAAEPDTQQGG